MQDIRLRRYLFSLILLCITVVLGIISCWSPFVIPSPPTNTPSPRNAWLTEWLAKPVCQPPCFLGITPGMTTITATVQLLTNTPGIQITHGPTTFMESLQLQLTKLPSIMPIAKLTETPDVGILAYDKTKELEYDFTTPTRGDGGWIKTDASGETVIYNVIDPGKDQFLRLSDIVGSFGPPSHVDLSNCQGNQCDVWLLYLPSGMALEMLLPAKFDENNTSTVVINPDLKVDNVWFYPPGQQGFKRAFNNHADTSIPWNGYISYTQK
jgi:hypothetical protein